MEKNEDDHVTWYLRRAIWVVTLKDGELGYARRRYFEDMDDAAMFAKKFNGVFEQELIHPKGSLFWRTT
jgi:hypothetical protein